MNLHAPQRRREFPESVKQAAWARCHVKGAPHCEDCKLPLQGRPEYDHDLPDGLYGEPTLENCVVRCVKCHKRKTHEVDRPLMQKADNIANKNAGITRRKRPWPKRKFG